MFTNTGLGAFLGNFLGESMENLSSGIAWVFNIPAFLLSLL